MTFAAAVSLWRFSVCAFVGLRIEGSMNACMELVGFSTSNKVKNHCLKETASKVETAILIHDCIAGNLHKDIFISPRSLKHS